MTTYEWITTMLVPITSLITWLAASRKRRNDTLGEMQRTIDMLVVNNNEVYSELVSTRKELAEARTEIDVLKSNQEKLLKENADLRTFIECNSKK